MDIKAIVEGIISEIGATIILALAGGIPAISWYTFYRDQVSFFELTFTTLFVFVVVCLFIYPLLGIELTPAAGRAFWIILIIFLFERTGILLRMKEKNMHKGERNGSRTGREESP